MILLFSSSKNKKVLWKYVLHQISIMVTIGVASVKCPVTVAEGAHAAVQYYQMILPFYSSKNKVF
jgi:hypothetical protein